MTLLFFGSSEFSLAALRACLEDSLKVLFVITTPDRRKGRGLKESPTPVALFAERHKIPVLAAESLKSNELIEKVAQSKPDLFVVSSYGKMIPSNWLKIPRLALNVHPSLLPQYRGAAPINWAILKGESETGVSIAEVTDSLDAGDIFCQKKIPLEDSLDSQSLASRLADLSYEELRRVFKTLREKKELVRTKQDNALSSYAPKLKKEDGLMDWKRPAADLFNRIRGLLPWPTAYTYLGKDQIQILKASLKDRSTVQCAPGAVVAIEKQGVLRVQTGKGILNIEKVRPAGRKEMSGADLARGRRLEPGFLFTMPSSGPPSPNS